MSQPTFALDIVSLVMVIGVGLGAMLMLGMMLAHKQTRALGVVLLAVGVLAVPAVLWTYLAMAAPHVQEVNSFTNSGVTLGDGFQRINGQLVSSRSHSTGRLTIGVWIGLFVLATGLIALARKLMRTGEASRPGAGWLAWTPLLLAPIAFMAVVRSSSHTQTRHDFIEGPATTHTVSARADDLPLLEQPTINLDDEPGAKQAGPELKIVESAPDWATHPAEDYQPGTQFAKELAKEHDADYVWVYSSPSMRKGIHECLRLERERVLKALRIFVALESGEKLPDEEAPLGMSTAELFDKFVKERQLVQHNDKYFTLHTLVAVSKERGGAELVAKTLDLAAREPADEPAAQDRPLWMDNPPERTGGLFTSVIEVGPHADLEDCYAATNRRLAETAFEYLRDNAPEVTSGDAGDASAAYFGMSPAALRELLWRDQHVEKFDSSVGEMQTLYTFVEITPEDGETLINSRKARKLDAERVQRAGGVMVVSVAVLGLVGLAFGLLKLDEATKGYYSKRLLIGVPVGIIGLLVFGLLISMH